MDDLDALLAQQANGPQPDSVDALLAAQAAQPTQRQSQAPGPLTAMQAANATATGVNRGVLAMLPGMIADTGANILDLGRAAYGYAGTKLGLMKPGDAPLPLNRHNVVGSSQWIEDQLNRNPYTASVIDNPRPDSVVARALNGGGAAVGTSLAGTPGNMLTQFGSGLLGQTVTDLTGNPNWGMVASMGPQTGITASQATVRGIMRGGEAGRQNMQQRVQDFQNAGVTPTVGLATGARVPMAIESVLAKTPGGAGVMAAKIQDIQDQLQGTANATRDAVSPTYGPVAAGDAIRFGAQTYRDRQQAIYGAMLDRALGKIPPDMSFPVSNMLAQGAGTLADIPNAPNVSAVLNQPRQFTSGLLGALSEDAAPKPASQKPTALLDPSGRPFLQDVPGTPGGLPMDGLLGLRSRIGELAYANNPLNADANTGALKTLYGGAKQDINNAGVLADAQRVLNGQPPAVSAGLSKADRFYSATQDVLDRVLAPLYKTAETSPERAYGRVESDAQNSGQNVQQLMSSLPREARQTVTATAIDRMGRARPGQQNAEGDAFSPQTFLTNYAKMSPEAKDALFGATGSATRDNLDSIATAVDRINQAGKVYANPSGTAGATNALGAFGGLALAAGQMASGNASSGLHTAGAVLTTMGVASLGAHAMTSPRFVNWLAQSTQIKPQYMQAHAQRLAALANQETDPQTRAEMSTLAQSLGASAK